MKKKITALATFLAFSCSTLANAAPMTVDFETSATDQFSAVQTVQGFDFSFSASGWFIGPGDTAFCPSCTDNGTSKLVAAGDRSGGASPTADVIMSVSGGGTFDVFGLDAATANSTEINRLGVLGTYALGGTTFTWLDIDGTFDPYALSGFTGLSSIAFYSENSGGYNFGGFSIDNILLSPIAVPAPGSFALLCLGLASVGFARRKKV